jgi:hypothetical protein
MTETELAWLAGWLEGEGTFVVTSGVSPSNGKRYPRVRVNVTSIDREPLEKAQAIAGGAINGPYGSHGIGYRPVSMWTISSTAKALDFLLQIEPLMVSARRQQQVRKAILAADEAMQRPHGKKANQ